MKTPSRFIVIDDDSVSNMLCRLTIKKTEHQLEIETFDIPEKGFEYIMSEYSKTGNDTPTVLFLDINMPTWTGWEFLENYDKLDEKIKRQIKIYMLSSSVDPKDKERARDDRNVVDYIVKPVNSKIVSDIIINSN
ncbi:MAG TPA: response regulator [Chitinophagales bacterium]|nr:response regulator [Chitinophagales bacterium]